MIPENFKPMLAVSSDKVKTQPNERYCSIKLDGCRVLFFGGVAYSRSMKPLPNKHLQEIAQDYSEALEGCDGEVISGGIYDKGCLQRSVSFCMNADKNDYFCIYLFDKFHPTKPWIERYSELKQQWAAKTSLFPDCVKVLQHYRVLDEEDEYLAYKYMDAVCLSDFEFNILEQGGEGVIVRDKCGKYKCGRSGTKTPELQKLKRMQDAEFEVIGCEQFESNQNESYKDELGHTKRSTSKEGKVTLEQLGSLVCSLPDGRTFNVGSGFTLEQRKVLWASKDELKGKLAKVQFFHYSPDGIPLLPVFLDFRHPDDMS